MYAKFSVCWIVYDVEIPDAHPPQKILVHDFV